MNNITLEIEESENPTALFRATSFLHLKHVESTKTTDLKFASLSLPLRQLYITKNKACQPQRNISFVIATQGDREMWTTQEFCPMREEKDTMHSLRFFTIVTGCALVDESRSQKSRPD